jgi:nucleotide-binding universal stress UspA family protein
MKTVDALTLISLKNTLFATDFSPYSKVALPYALSLARRYGAKLYAAHVYPVVPSWESLAEIAERQRESEAQRLDEQLKGVPHELVFRVGDIGEVLSETIEENEIDLLVMGTHGRTGVKKLLMGSVAEEIYRQAACPVLTVGPHVSANPEDVVDLHEILYATDFSRESLAALPYAVSFAQEHQAQLALLYVLERADASIKNAELNAASLLHRLHLLVPPEAELWCHPKCFVKYGSPADQILELAKTRHADLIVLGVRRPEGHLGASTHLPWATAQKVVSQAGCPVLTVRG